jgi:hypothetical protein
LTISAILLPNGNLLIPIEPEDPDEGTGVREIGSDHPDYSQVRAVSVITPRRGTHRA